MRSSSLGTSEIPASNIILGCMRIKDLDDAEIRELVSTALDEGVSMFDHADIYGGDCVKFMWPRGGSLNWPHLLGVRGGWFANFRFRGLDT